VVEVVEPAVLAMQIMPQVTVEQQVELLMVDPEGLVEPQEVLRTVFQEILLVAEVEVQHRPQQQVVPEHVVNC
jgi:hypothetical protein